MSFFVLAFRQTQSYVFIFYFCRFVSYTTKFGLINFYIVLQNFTNNFFHAHSATHNDEMCNFYIMFFYKSDYGDVNPGCSRSTGSFPYPADSDITLAEVERKASSLAHGM